MIQSDIHMEKDIKLMVYVVIQRILPMIQPRDATKWNNAHLFIQHKNGLTFHAYVLGETIQSDIHMENDNYLPPRGWFILLVI
mmetsp:Transcript_6333/g.9298  ORF Transcript_6333/g.9298 Transcript_6333/m.9298 type:complete len:83 (-) Transcript_6333:113-361(-)